VSAVPITTCTRSLRPNSLAMAGVMAVIGLFGPRTRDLPLEQISH